MGHLYTVERKQCGNFRRQQAYELYQEIQQVRYAFAKAIQAGKRQLRGSGVIDNLRHTVARLKERYREEFRNPFFVTVIKRVDRGYIVEREIYGGESRAQAIQSIKEELAQVRRERRAVRSKILLRTPNTFLHSQYKKRLQAHKAPTDNAQYVGIEIECITPRNADFSSLWPFAKYVNLGGDGSIEHGSNEDGTEVRVCVKREEVREVVPGILKALRGLGAKVNRSCGLHVHLDQRQKDEASVTKVWTRLVRAQSLLYTIVPKSRRANRYCRRTRLGDFRNAVYGDRYRAINANAYGRYKTLEVRLFGGTLDGEKVVNWIETLHGIADGADVLRCPRSFESAKKHWRISESNIAWAKERQTKFRDLDAPVAESEGEEAAHNPNVASPSDPLELRRRGYQPPQPAGTVVRWNRLNENANVQIHDEVIQPIPSPIYSGEIGQINGISFADSQATERDIAEASGVPDPHYQAIVHPTTARELQGAAEALSEDVIQRAVRQLQEANAQYFNTSLFRQLYDPIESNGGEENV